VNPPEFVLDVDVAPAGALTRLAAAINQRPKRAFGVLKTTNEYIGVVSDDAFEIWERRQRAVHAIGRVVPRRGGARIEVRSAISPPTRVLLAVFFGLYVAVAAGIALRPPDPAVTIDEIVIAAGGLIVLGVLFITAARRQRADLRAFLKDLFGESAGQSGSPG
jgi:hypothetical protein